MVWSKNPNTLKQSSPDKNALYYTHQKDNQGIVMVNFYTGYVSCAEESNLTQVAGEADIILCIDYQEDHLNISLYLQTTLITLRI